MSSHHVCGKYIHQGKCLFFKLEPVCWGLYTCTLLSLFQFYLKIDLQMTLCRLQAFLLFPCPSHSHKFVAQSVYYVSEIVERLTPCRTCIIESLKRLSFRGGTNSQDFQECSLTQWCDATFLWISQILLDYILWYHQAKNIWYCDDLFTWQFYWFLPQRKVLDCMRARYKVQKVVQLSLRYCHPRLGRLQRWCDTSTLDQDMLSCFTEPIPRQVWNPFVKRFVWDLVRHYRQYLAPGLPIISIPVAFRQRLHKHFIFALLVIIKRVLSNVCIMYNV